VHTHFYKVVDCGAPNNPENGDVTFTLTVYNAIAVYSCEEGYNLVPSEAFRTCQANENWSEDDRACQRKCYCKYIMQAQNRIRSSTLTLRLSVLNLFLPISFTFKFLSIHLPLSCHFIAVNCGTEPNPINGQFSAQQTTLGSVAMYTCNTGYDLVGQESVMCQPSGEWSSSPPNCIGKAFD
jgi:CUB/sushi domain-containing protein